MDVKVDVKVEVEVEVEVMVKKSADWGEFDVKSASEAAGKVIHPGMPMGGGYVCSGGSSN